MASSVPVLSLLETRALGVLIEKERTVPDTYPLSLNALVAGCNQKSNRDPVIEAREAEVQEAIDRLKSLSLVVESSGGRVARYAHNTGRVLGVGSQAVALLAALMLRGPQTAGELRMNTERLHKFLDISSVEAYLHELAERSAGALVVELPRQPGARENRWAHLLSGTPEIPQPGTQRDGPTVDVGLSEVTALKTRLAQLESEVAFLRETVKKLSDELGVPMTRDDSDPA